MVVEGSGDDPDTGHSTAHTTSRIPSIETLNPDNWDMFALHCRSVTEVDGTWEVFEQPYPTIESLARRDAEFIAADPDHLERLKAELPKEQRRYDSLNARAYRTILGAVRLKSQHRDVIRKISKLQTSKTSNHASKGEGLPSLPPPNRTGLRCFACSWGPRGFLEPLG